MASSQSSVRQRGARDTLRVALVGNPNTGKSTLFNALVGMRQRVGNYPGVTVEKKSGRCTQGPWTVEVVDLPGVVSLAVTSADELITLEVLCGLRPDTPPPDVVVLVVDASHLDRQLYLVGQVLELGLPTVVVLNMMDVAEKEGMEIDVDELARRLGVPVVPTVAHRRQGVGQLRQAICELAEGRHAPAYVPCCLLPSPVEDELARLEELIGDLVLKVFRAEEVAARSRAKTLLGKHGLAAGEDVNALGGSSTSTAVAGKLAEPAGAESVGAAESAGEARLRSFARFLVRRFLLDPPGGLISEVLLPQLDERVRAEIAAARARLSAAGIDLATVEPDVRFAWARELTRGVVRRVLVQGMSWTERVDTVLTHPVWGLGFLMVMMLLTFQAVFVLADPLVELFQVAVAWCSDQVTGVLPAGVFREFVVGGLLSGVGNVVAFVPPIMVLFLFIGVLEDCGYLTRAAFVMDRWLTPIGLSGKCFIPLLSCCSCAVPGIMATRVIDDPRDRLRTILVAPLMTCSARLPVFTLMTALLVPAEATLLGGWIRLQGLALASMYFLGIAAAAVSAFVLSRTIVPGSGGLFILELPHYKWPDISTVLFRVTERLKVFLRNAGTVILGVSVLMWLLVNFPRNEELVNGDPEVRRLTAELKQTSPEDAQYEELAQQLQLARLAAIQRHSILGMFGRAIEPIFWPAGWDWRVGCAVLASFPAREVVVANIGVLFQVAEGDGELAEGHLQRIRQKLREARWEGSERPLFSGPTVLSIMVFFALCVQCAPTLVVIGRETSSWRWPLFVFVYMTLLAYVAAVVTYQVASVVMAG